MKNFYLAGQFAFALTAVFLFAGLPSCGKNPEVTGEQKESNETAAVLDELALINEEIQRLRDELNGAPSIKELNEMTSEANLALQSSNNRIAELETVVKNNKLPIKNDE